METSRPAAGRRRSGVIKGNVLHQETPAMRFCSAPRRGGISSASAGITRLSSLILAHAPNQTPPIASGFPWSMGLCRLLRAPAGRWSFPTLSPQSLCGCLDPYPAVLRRCSGPLPSRRTSASPQVQQVRRTRSPTTRLLRGTSISGLQSFLYVQAPTLARPPDRAHRGGSMSSGRLGRLHHAMDERLPCSNCGIATCLNRATDMAGLSPAGLWPCRPLPEPQEVEGPRTFPAPLPRGRSPKRYKTGLARV